MKAGNQKSEVGSQKQADRTNSAPLVFVISAPSGGGKTTLCNNLLAAYPNMTRAITSTTRPPRTGERDGVDYYFFSETEFARRVAAGEFLEHATVFGNRYGTLKSELLGKLRQGKDVLLNIDVQGAAAVRARAAADADLRGSLVTVFLTPESLATLAERLARRGTDAPDVVARRLAVAREEIARWQDFDYLIFSTTVDEDLRRMQAVVAAERMRTTRAQSPEF